MKAAIEELEEKIGCPVFAAVATTSTPPSSLLHLSTSDRNRSRSIDSIVIPSEKLISQLKKELSNSHHSQTGSFSNGAYICDPLGFISSVTKSSPFVCVGGDTGAGYTKLGVSYLTPSNTQSFICLLVYEGDDGWEELNKLKSKKEIKFTGESSSHSDIFSILQHLIATRSAYLNGDWAFINSVLGLKSASATQPCPICTVCKNQLLTRSTYRSVTSKESLHPRHPPLITIDSSRVVPTPLHIFLGIGNRIIGKCFSKIWGKEKVKSTIQSIKTIHTAGCGGRSDWSDLNGQEIRKWVKKNSATD